MYKFPYHAEVLVNGRPVKEYLHKDQRVYIEGRKGTEFTLRIENESPERILAVPTIDGLSVMNGELGGFDSGGYILNPWENITIPGWRVNEHEVAKFFFADKNKSYAQKISQGGNQGVIGIAIFQEKERKIVTRKLQWGKKYEPDDGDTKIILSNYSSMDFSCDCNSSSGEPVNAFSSSIGTGFGKAATHHVIESSFEKSDVAESVIFEIYYGSKEDLKKMGVYDYCVRKVSPSAFPKEKQYCKPPKDWVK